MVEEKLDIVGAVVSRVIVTDEVAAAAGPVELSAAVAPFSLKTGTTVPSPVAHPDTVRVYVLPVPVTANEQPVSVPELLKSSAATSVTAESNVTVKVKVDPLVFVVDEVNVGANGSSLVPQRATPVLPPCCE